MSNGQGEGESEAGSAGRDPAEASTAIHGAAWQGGGGNGGGDGGGGDDDQGGEGSGD